MNRNGTGRSLERRLVEKMYARADVRIDGDRPFDIKVSDERFFRRILLDGQLGMGESYVDGWWSCDRIDEMTARFVNAGMHRESLWNPRVALYRLKVKLSGVGRSGKASEIAHRHYDL